MQDRKVIIGRIGSTYGVKGWVKVHSYCDPIDNILQYSPWQIQHQSQWKLLAVESAKMQGNSIIAKFTDYNDPESIRPLANCAIAVDRTVLQPLAEDEYYWSDLEGLNVITLTGETLGIVDYLYATGSNDILVVQGATKQHLVPYTTSVIKSVDLEHKTITVDWDANF